MMTKATNTNDLHLKVNSMGYPLRPGQEQCRFFRETGGLCGFRTTCRYDHPEGIAQKRLAKLRAREEKEKRSEDGQEQCRNGVSANGNTPKEPHPIRNPRNPKITEHNALGDDVSNNNSDKSEAQDEIVDLNSVGLPIRPRALICEYYIMSGGYCKYGRMCKYNHPEEDCAQRLAKQKVKRATAVQGESVFVEPAGEARRELHMTEHLVKPNLNQAEIKSILASLTLNSRGYPLRAEKDDCRDYMRTHGDCKRRLACPFNHPQDVGEYGKLPSADLIDDEAGAALNSVGLPLRDGADVCKFFVRSRGHCKRKSKCPFHHPESIALERVASILVHRQEHGDSASEEAHSSDEENVEVPEKPKRGSKFTKDSDGFEEVKRPSSHRIKSGEKEKPPQITYNSDGFPIYHGVEECQHYINSLGHCKYARECRYSHPEWVTDLRRAEEAKQKQKKAATASASVPSSSMPSVNPPTPSSASVDYKEKLSRLGLPPNACYHQYIEGNCADKSKCNMLHDVQPKQNSKQELQNASPVPALSDNAVLKTEVTALLQRASMDFSKAPILEEALSKCGAKRRVSEAVLPQLARLLNEMKLPANEIKEVCKVVFDMRKEHLAEAGQ